MNDSGPRQRCASGHIDNTTHSLSTLWCDIHIPYSSEQCSTNNDHPLSSVSRETTRLITGTRQPAQTFDTAVDSKATRPPGANVLVTSATARLQGVGCAKIAVDRLLEVSSPGL